MDEGFLSNLFSKSTSYWLSNDPNGIIHAFLCSRSTAFPNASLFFACAEGGVGSFRGHLTPFDRT